MKTILFFTCLTLALFNHLLKEGPPVGNMNTLSIIGMVKGSLGSWNGMVVLSSASLWL